jgi:hypothetical protein
MFNPKLREGVAPSVVTFNTLIHVWGKHRSLGAGGEDDGGVPMSSYQPAR